MIYKSLNNIIAVLHKGGYIIRKTENQVFRESLSGKSLVLFDKNEQGKLTKVERWKIESIHQYFEKGELINN